MKKKIRRGLRDLADQLPRKIIRRKHTTYHPWEDLTKQQKESFREALNTPTGIDEPIGERKTWPIWTERWEEVDHFRALKNAYTKNGLKGVEEYVIGVHSHNSRMAKKYPEMFKKVKSNVT